MFIVLVRKKTFSKSAQRMIESDRYYIYNTAEIAYGVAKNLSQDAEVVFTAVAPIKKKFEGRANG